MDDQSRTLLIKLIIAGYLFFEQWLGRTDRVKANSTLDLIVNVGAAVIKTYQDQKIKKILLNKDGE